MMRKQIIFAFSSIFMLMGCKGQEQQLECYNQELKQLQTKPVYEQVKRGLKDTIVVWTNKYKNILLTGIKDKEEEWSVDDGVFFNTSYTKAILLIPTRDLHKWAYEDEGILTSLDYIHMVYANLEKDGWHYYYASMPSMVVPRESYHKTTAMTFSELAKIGRVDVLQGYYKKGTCEINDTYFDEWDIAELKRQHQKFIKE
jgi:uncharacterized lipoprotein NlpE involved in copper resistance